MTTQPPATTPTPEARARSVAERIAATVLRNKQQRRAERLSEIRSQTADGSLTIRHMTAAEHTAASEQVRVISKRNQIRQRRYRGPV
jgi:hypothetical protein